jgi:hypothetical protein
MAKVLFELDSTDWHGHGSETLWAEPVQGTDNKTFQLMNSPFFATGVSYLDVVDVTPLEDSDDVFNFERVNKRGGHSTFMILFEDAEPRFDAYWASLKTVGCSYEGAHIKLSIGRRHLLSVDVPAFHKFG